ncbi:hypothetical protein M422DRAFT_261819 [Sphaerobolus stellatus SS14]|uniref:Uncharacterized protein n=1 Tax=Sphaerobolus stellatus (strain SS14) TaxID=990650 RepID=A0A0C9VE91_SPHS4|nr:hypothetical protein M422DRAFT_261819 [Sphaerobolus stellatus SS14]
MPPHREHSPARQERNKKLLITYIAFNMAQDDEEGEDPILLALMAWATRERVAIGDQTWGEKEDSPGLVWKRQKWKRGDSERALVTRQPRQPTSRLFSTVSDTGLRCRLLPQMEQTRGPPKIQFAEGPPPNLLPRYNALFKYSTEYELPLLQLHVVVPILLRFTIQHIPYYTLQAGQYFPDRKMIWKISGFECNFQLSSSPGKWLEFVCFSWCFPGQESGMKVAQKIP